MDDWQDDRAILDQLSRLVAGPGAAEDLARAAGNALRAASSSDGAMGRLTAAVYARLDAPARPTPRIADQQRIYAALEEAHGGHLEIQAEARPNHAWLIRFAHVAVRFRYTRAGRWIVRMLPPSWQRRLKARLLASM